MLLPVLVAALLLFGFLGYRLARLSLDARLLSVTEAYVVLRAVADELHSRLGVPVVAGTTAFDARGGGVVEVWVASGGEVDVSEVVASSRGVHVFLSLLGLLVLGEARWRAGDVLVVYVSPSRVVKAYRMVLLGRRA